MTIKTWHIRIKGQVQGVGFRPFVWEAARQRGLGGQVANGMAGVEIEVSGQAEEIRNFYEYVLHNAPKGSKITHSELLPVDEVEFQSFTIRESTHSGTPVLLLTPDVALCDTCREELHTPGNRRYHYPFTTCTSCGPRYSIQHALPYDRPQTSMSAFVMCPACQAEYDSPEDRRFYAQTNSCPECGIRMRLYGIGFQSDTNIIENVARAWADGKIVAVKGIGGYLLCCDATNALAVQTLRERKRRPSKPFALLYPDEVMLRGDVHLPQAALDSLKRPEAPIVLLALRETPASGIAVADIAPGLDRIGAMLPYAPLLELLAKAFGKPLVATSANFSGSPIAYQESDLAALEVVADLFLTHNREIQHPQDDSVIALGDAQTLFLRRSRGYAPAMLVPGIRIPPAVALGAEMKSSFSFAYADNLFVSQYIGDLSGFETQQRFETLLRRVLQSFQVKPQAVLCDRHPAYFSTSLAERLAEEWQTPLHRVQHHEAHFAAVLAENEWFKATTSVLGVIWDGTGLGNDGQIWGGEFFTLKTGKIERYTHFPYFPVLLGDKMAREPRLSALALFGPEAVLQNKFSPREWDLYGKMREQSAALQSSSLGRVFDAMASLLGYCDQSSYEGEAAMLLEAGARRYFRAFEPWEQGLEPLLEAVTFSVDQPKTWVQALQQGFSTDFLAARFHLALVEWIREIAGNTSISTLAFSGGVFQNALLLRLIRKLLSPDYQLLFHRQLSPNDECISFGQLAYYQYFNQNHSQREVVIKITVG